MRFTTPILAVASVIAVGAAGFAAGRAQAGPPLQVRQVASTSTSTQTSSGPTVTVIGTGTVTGTPDQATMSFGVEVSGGSAGSAYGGEAAQAQKLIGALRAAGIADKDIQTQWVSLYYDSQRGTYTASSSVSAVVRNLAHAGSTIDAAVGAAGNSIRFNGISLTIADTSSLMGAARVDAMHDAATKAQQYAQGAGVRLGEIVSISESDNTPRPVYYGAEAAPVPSQPIEAGQQTLAVSVTVVYALSS